LSSFAATIIRFGGGIFRDADAPAAVPEQLLELYDYEGCPYCRKVRETLCELDLDVLVHPVAHGSSRREHLEQLGGRMQVPYLVDPNVGTTLYESEDISTYLQQRYGGGRQRGLASFALVNTFDSFLASAARLGRGIRVTSGIADAPRPSAPLELYNMEGSPYCRKVREALTELDIEHVVRNVPRGSPKRDELLSRAGKVQVPYLIDLNTGSAMFESDDIVAYLYERYGPDTSSS
jgi:glutathione S-transferase